MSSVDRAVPTGRKVSFVVMLLLATLLLGGTPLLLVGCKGAIKAASRMADDAAKAGVRAGDDVARAGARGADDTAKIGVAPAGSADGMGAAVYGARAAARLARHPSWSAWASFNEHRPSGAGVLRLGLYESQSKRPVTAGGKATVLSFRREKDEAPIHSEEIPFAAGDFSSGAVAKYSKSPWRTWAGGLPEFWVVIHVEADGKAVPVIGERAP